ncbi:MAG: PfkB family carbohydrate kinase [Ferruginibacter sp.]|nr:PfkB family carbohydrate kinase [Ferruginibacter sp.]
MVKTNEIELLRILEVIKETAVPLKNKKVTLGFDAFIDHLVKVIRHKGEASSATYFESSLDFGQYIIDKDGKNFSIEIEDIASKIGGNMPITANALARSVNAVNCIGPLGYPAIHSTFKELSNYCKLYSFGNPGFSKLLEFKTGKIILAESGKLQFITWEMIRDTIGKDTLVSLFTDTDLAVILNWGELDYSTAVWKGLLNEIMLPAAGKKRSLGFFDLSDCSSRTPEQVSEALTLISAFAEYWDVTLSLNLNEAAIVFKVLTGHPAVNMDDENTAQVIFEKLGIETILIHHSKNAIAVSKKGVEKRESFFVANPLISTGAGDNFNAGYCLGRLMNLDNGASLVLGNATASWYMRSGCSPSLQDLQTFLTAQGQRNNS